MKGEFNSLPQHSSEGEVVEDLSEWSSALRLLWPQLSLLITSVSLFSTREQQLDPPQKERLGAALAEMDRQLRKLVDTPWLCQPLDPSDEEVCGHPRCSGPPFDACNECALCRFGVKMMSVCLGSSLVKCCGRKELGWY